MMNYEERKEERRHRYNELHGKKMVTCCACNGSGYYDSHGSPRCSACNGRGKVHEDS